MKIKQNIISAVCFMFALLFLWDMDVEASATNSTTQISSTTLSDYTNSFYFNIGTDGITYRDTDGYIYLYNNGTETFTFDTGLVRTYNVSGGSVTSYDYMNLILYPNAHVYTQSCSVYDNVNGSLPTPTCSVRPYMVVFGEKYYLDAFSWNNVNIPYTRYNFQVSFGYEIDINVNPNLFMTTINPQNLAFYVVALESKNDVFEVWGGTYISSGQNKINTTLANTYTLLYNRFNYIQNLLEDMVSKLTGQTDTEKSDSVTTEIETTFTELNNSSKEVTDTATANLVSFTMPDDGFESYGTAFLSAVSLVSGMMQSIYTASGNYTVLIAITFGLTIASMLVGLYKFFKV